MALVLLGTQACHLCDEAQSLLLQLQGALTQDLFTEDIADSAAQVERYGLRIPVLLHEHSGAELDWPFDLPRLYAWLQQQGCLRSVDSASASS